MTQSTLFQTIEVLTPLERKYMQQWLDAGFFNRRKHPVVLWEYLTDCLEQKKEPNQTDAIQQLACVEPLFKRKKEAEPKDAQAQALRLVMSELLSQIEHFLVYQACFKGGIDADLFLARQYRQRGLDKQFGQCIDKSKKQWDKQPHRHAEHFDAVAAVEYEQYQYSSTRKRTEALNLQAVSDATDTAFIARKLRLTCFALSHQAVYNAEYDMGLLAMLLAFLKERPHLLAIPAIGLYYRCYQLMKQPDNDAPFAHFKTMLLEHKDILPRDEQRNLHLFAINFCVRRINKLELVWYREVLELYQSALTAELLIENRVLSPFAFNNITAIALKTGDLAWATSFVDTYVSYLEPKHRTPIYHLNMARIAYAESRQKDALIHLQSADYKDLINNLIAKTLQLKIYYETGEHDALEAHLQSMKTYLSRQRSISYHRTNYQNIIRYAHKLLRCNMYSKTEKEKLRAALMAEPTLTEKEWFLGQLA